VRTVLESKVDQIDAAIRAIREAVFSLNPGGSGGERA